MSGKIIVLSGERGAGKTSTCLRLAKEAKRRGLSPAGVICPARLINGRKVGIDLMDVRTAERRALAEADERPAALRTPAYRFHQDAMNWGAAIIKGATPCTLLIIDELGPLELVRGQGWANALDTLAAGQFERAVVVVRPDLIPHFNQQVPGRLASLIVLSGGPILDAVTAILAQLGTAGG